MTCTIDEKTLAELPYKTCEYITIGGGGIYGLSYVGAMRALETARGCPFHTDVKGCAGTSVGAIISAAIVLGAEFSRIDDLLREYTWTGIALSTIGFIERRGLTDHSFLRSLVTEVVVSLGFSANITLNDVFRITRKDLYICATDLATTSEVIFHHDAYPDVCLVDAVVASCCIPILFEPLELKGMVLTDGFLSQNVMFHQFPIEKTLILRTDRYSSLETWRDYIQAVISCGSVLVEERSMNSLDSEARKSVLTLPRHALIRPADLSSVNPNMVRALLAHGYLSVCNPAIPRCMQEVVGLMTKLHMRLTSDC